MSSVIVRPGALGDTILTIPLLESIQASTFGEPTTLLGNSAYRDLIPGSFGFAPVDGIRWIWLFGRETSPTGRQRSRPQDAGPTEGAACPTHRQEIRFERAFLVLNRPEDVERNLREAGVPWIRHATSSPPEGAHLVEHLHRGLGVPVPPRRPALTHLAPAEKADVIWLHPGSGGPRKCVPLAVMSAVAESVMVDTGWDMAITVGEADGFLTAMPEWNRLVRHPRVRVVAQQPLSSLCTLLGSSRLFLGNDSGISHLAAGLGIPSVVFFVATDPVQWAPWVPDRQTRIIDWRGGRVMDPGNVRLWVNDLL